MRFKRLTGAAASIGLALGLLASTAAAQAPRFEVTYTAAAHKGPLTGRLLLVLAKYSEPEPRFQVSPLGPMVLGMDVEGVRPGEPVVINEKTLGYPTGLSELEPGEYYAQVVFNVYEQVKRADGHTLWLPMNDGRIEVFSNRAGNLYSDVQKVTIGSGGTVKIAANWVNPPAEPPADTEWIKRVKIKSEKLTRFWGRPIYIHATVLLPKGFAENPNVRYPTVYTFGHSIPFSFTTDSTRFRQLGVVNPVTGLETGYDFYKSWSSDDFPRMVAIGLQQQTPYFPDSYSMNSANNGPYADALIEEVIPYLEKEFRLIPQAYARLVEGASTGGWQALALQLKYPDFFGGAWVFQPDPIDFSRYQLVDIYNDDNAFSVPVGRYATTERPFQRTVEGQVRYTVRQMSRYEEVLGSRGRSGQGQLHGWEAVYGPVGPDGYPKPLWDKLTGKIDREVANYMRENGYDLREYAERNWATIGPKLVGKLHFILPDMDDFYLNLAMYKFEEFLQRTTNPHVPAKFSYGRPTKGHSWHPDTWADLVRQMASYIKEKSEPQAVTSM